MARRYTRLSPEQREEALQYYKNGASQYEVAEMFDCSQTAISKLVRESGYDRTHVGGVISKSIETVPVTNNATPQKPRESLRILERTVVLRGNTTPLTYTIKTGEPTVIIAYNDDKLEIDVALIDAFIDELKAVKEWM